MKKEDISKLIGNFKARNIEALYFGSMEEARVYLLDVVPCNATVGIGHSATLGKMGLTDSLNKRGNTVYDKTLAKTKEEVRALKKKALLAEWYVTGSNAVSMEGHIVNIDHSGNRVAAMIYGPDRVIVVVGVNKIVDTLQEAIDRVKNIASPRNAKRAGFNPPCVELGKCIDCRSKERVCNSMVIIEGQSEPDRMTVIIVGEEAGY